MVIWANLDKNITFWKPNILNRTFIAKKESMWRVFDGDSQTGVGGALSEYKISPISVPSIVCTYKYKYFFLSVEISLVKPFWCCKTFLHFLAWAGVSGRRPLPRELFGLFRYFHFFNSYFLFLRLKVLW